MLVVGDREREAGEVALREHHAGDRGSVSVEEFAARVREEISARSHRE
jgi:threonyl-tRNA synthetase